MPLAGTAIVTFIADRVVPAPTDLVRSIVAGSAAALSDLASTPSAPKPVPDCRSWSTMVVGGDAGTVLAQTGYWQHPAG